MKRAALLALATAAVFLTACPFTCGSAAAWCEQTGQCRCTGPLGCCVVPDKPCSHSTECCDGRACIDGLCREARCGPAGSGCALMFECCSGNCDLGRCQCSEAFGSCNTSTDCCSGACVSGTCEDGFDGGV